MISFAPSTLEDRIREMSSALSADKREFDEAVTVFKTARTYKVSQDLGGSVSDYHYYIYPFKGITLTNFKLLQTLARYLAKMVPRETEVILTIESDGISVATLIAAELGLPLVICKSFHYNMDMVELPQKTGYYKRTMYMPRVIEGKKIAIVDCMISTGGTVQGMVNAVAGLSKTEITGIFCVNNKSNYRMGADEFGGYPYYYLFDTSVGEDGQVKCLLSSHGKRTLWEAIDQHLFALTKDVALYSNMSKSGMQVGALILDSDTLEIKAWGSRRGDLHAEQDAVSMMKQNCPNWRDRRFTLYSTLEPCTERYNEGHTPCAEIIAEVPQITWIVIGRRDDTNAHINGTGISLLCQRGKYVRVMDPARVVYKPYTMQKVSSAVR